MSDDDRRPTVGDLLDDPVFGAALQEEVERGDYESDLRLLRIYQEGSTEPPKSLWRRIIRYRKKHQL